MESQAKKKAGRRVFLINPKFQLQVMGMVLGLTAVVIAAFYAADWYFFWQLASEGKRLGLPENHVFFRFINEQRTTMNWIFGLSAFLAGATISVGGLLLSHRIAGPLYRLHKHLLAVAAGNTTSDVKFRDKDYFQELPPALNQVLARMRGTSLGAVSATPPPPPRAAVKKTAA